MFEVNRYQREVSVVLMVRIDDYCRYSFQWKYLNSEYFSDAMDDLLVEKLMLENYLNFVVLALEDTNFVLNNGLMLVTKDK